MARIRLALLATLLAALTLTACGDNPDRTYSGVASATHDCGKERKVAVNGTGGTFTFTGSCERVSLSGANNTLAIEAAKALDVKGDGNNVRIGAVDAISVTGSQNNVTYRTGLPGEQPRSASASGNRNNILQAK